MSGTVQNAPQQAPPPPDPLHKPEETTVLRTGPGLGFEGYREITDMLPVSVCEIDLQQRFCHVNRFALRQFGYSEEDFDRGVYLRDIFPPKELKRASENMRTVIMTGTAGSQNEYVVTRKDGTPMNVLINSSPIYKDGKPVGIRSCLIDITSRKKAEDQVREHEETLSTIFEMSPAGLGLYGAEGALVEANAAFRQLSAVILRAPGPEHLLPSLVAGLVATAPAGSAPEGTGAPGVTMRSGICYIPGAPGSDHWIEWRIPPALGKGSQHARTVVVLHDITERRRAEEEKARKAKELADREITRLRDSLRTQSACPEIVTCDEGMRQILAKLPAIAATGASVLIQGPSGTGKELVARSLHQLSPRRNNPFVVINCGSVPDTLLESELFGYKRGAFTDARQDRKGKFALANGGTLFLDEIGDISASMQVRLRRAVQERVIEPLGSEKPEPVYVRIIAATNKDLQALVTQGTFREDLLFRLNVVKVTLPALRERRSDIPLLCRSFVEEFNVRYGREVRGIADDAMGRLMAHDFPGNVRELKNMIEHAFVFCTGDTLAQEHFPAEFAEPQPRVFDVIGPRKALARNRVVEALVATQGNKAAAARMLGVHKTTLFRQLRKLRGDGAGPVAM